MSREDEIKAKQKELFTDPKGIQERLKNSEEAKMTVEELQAHDPDRQN